MLLEGVEVAHGRRVQDRRAELDVGQRVLRVPPGGTAAGEERLQRLCGDLHDGLTLEDPRPAALEPQLTRCEHAQLQ